MSSDEERVVEALDRMNDTALNPDDNLDIAALIRRVIQRRTRIQNELQAMVRDLDEVAASLRRLRDEPGTLAEKAREQIAVDFADGALAVDRARLSLELATRDLEYLRYLLL